MKYFSFPQSFPNFEGSRRREPDQIGRVAATLDKKGMRDNTYSEKVAELEKRANELAAVMAKPLLLQTEFGAMRQRLAMPPALPGEEFEFDEEQ